MANLPAVGKIASVARVYEIQQRVATIEKNLGISGDFQTRLEREIARQEKIHADAMKILETQPVVDAAKISEVPEVGALAGIEAVPNFSANSAAETFDVADDEEIIEPVSFSVSDTERMIETAARRNGVDPELVRAIATAESGIDQSAISGVGAIGVMQLMPETAAGLGVDPYDERQNIYGGAKYIRQLLDKFDGNLTKAIAAYNAGPGAVQNYGGVPPYAETQNYVGRVMDFYVG